MFDFIIHIMLNEVTSKMMKIPFKYCRGSVADRCRRSDLLVYKLFNDMRGGFKNGEMPVSKAQKYVNGVMPKGFKVIVKSAQDDDFIAFNDVLYSSKTGKVNAMTIELMVEDKKIKEHNLIDFVHEFKHISDYIFHPKYLMRSKYMATTGMNTKKYNTLYDDFLYNEEYPVSKRDKKEIIKKLERKIRKFLRRMPAEEKMNYIQDARYCLESEDGAYSTQYRFAKKMKKRRMDVSEDDLYKWNKEFMFKEKINLLKRIGFEVVQNERTKLKLLLKKQNTN